MNSFRRSTFLGLCFIVLLTAVSLTSQVRSYLTLPTHQKLPVGERLSLDIDFPSEILQRLSVYIKAESKNVLNLQNGDLREQVLSFNKDWPVAMQPGKVNLQLKLFGIIPLRQVTVNVVPRVEVYPGGHSIGVMLQSQGVMVIGYSPVVGENGNRHYPAKEAGVQIGDQIISINGVKVNRDESAAQIIDKAGSSDLPINMVIERQGKEHQISINPFYCQETDRYRIGLYIRDSAAGVGTLTFYDAKSQVYGALGHLIMDTETYQGIDLGHGNIVSAAIQGIQQGKRGQPGEKIGTFQAKGINGDIKSNTTVGIFGELQDFPSNTWFTNPVPIAYVNEIEPGPANIYTVVDGNKVEKFAIEIERIMPQKQLDGKGLIIRITDSKLLSITGGIIQGMSGSPIVQDGKLVGAVTHVFVNDPTRGYGVPVEWMILKTSLIKSKAKALDLSSAFILFLIN